MNLFKIITTSLLIYLTIKINKIIMTQKEAVLKLADILAQVGKVRGEVEKLVAAAANQENISDELANAINDVQTAVGGVDDLNTDELTTG